MPDDDLDYRQMRARVEKRVKKRAEFVLHLSIYVTANLMIWGLFLLLVSRSDACPDVVDVSMGTWFSRAWRGYLPANWRIGRYAGARTAA